MDFKGFEFLQCHQISLKIQANNSFTKPLDLLSFTILSSSMIRLIPGNEVSRTLFDWTLIELVECGANVKVKKDAI